MDRDRINWPSLSQLPGVAAVASAISARWPVWVGISTRAGLTLPILTDGGSSNGCGLCRHFIGRVDRAGGCRNSLLKWSDTRGRGPQRCHAGLWAETLSVDQGRACLYVSGFLHGERKKGAEPVMRRGEELRIEEELLSPLVDEVAVLNQADRDALQALLAVIRAVIEAKLGDAGPSPAFRHDYSHIVGQTTPMLRLFSLLDRIVRNDSTVLIQGENGTGKELVAQAIHANSKRRGRAFVTQNCSALNDNLLDSELFGHRRGAFTGAVADKKGLFELTDGGTLFLDEVGDMSPMMQVKLLRVLQEGTFLPVGDTVTRKVDVRLIAASNRILREMVREGSFREDLFYRVNVISLVIPPLRHREGDIPRLLDHFLEEYARKTRTPKKELANDTRGLLTAWDWPGNVRELRHEVERLAVLSGGDPQIEADLVSRRIVESVDPTRLVNDPDQHATLPEAVEALQRRMILDALESTAWNKTRAAQKLSVSRRNLIRKVQAFGLRRRRKPK